MGCKARIGPQGWDLGIEAKIWPIKAGNWASRLNLNQVGGGRVTQGEEEEEEEEKIPHVYEKLCSLTCSLKSACLNMSKDFYSLIDFKIRKKKTDLNELKCSKTPSQMRSYAHEHVSLYLNAQTNINTLPY